MSANADKVCRHCFYKGKFADMQTYGCAICIFIYCKIDSVLYIFIFAISYESISIP